MRLRAAEEILAYVDQVAKRVAIDVIRGQGRERAVRELVVRASAERPEPERAGDLDLIEALLQRCYAQDRTAIELWARGVPQHRIAEALGIGFEAHRSRWRRLWPTLRGRFSGAWLRRLRSPRSP